jgi:hypothetical protein
MDKKFLLSVAAIAAAAFLVRYGVAHYQQIRDLGIF